MRELCKQRVDLSFPHTLNIDGGVDGGASSHALAALYQGGALYQVSWLVDSTDLPESAGNDERFTGDVTGLAAQHEHRCIGDVPSSGLPPQR